VTTVRRSSATESGSQLIQALADRDFGRLSATLAPDVRMRALIPPGPIELTGAEAAAAKFSSWFGDAEEIEVVASGSDTVADRLHVFYRLRVEEPPATWKLVEQHLVCTIDAERIAALDLLCTGFRPDPDRADTD
jgi:hypothetical protein